MRRVVPLVLASLVGSLLLFAAQSTPATATTGADSPAWAAATQCMVAQKGIQVQIVVDESSSLVHTDRGHVRDQLVKGWLTDLLGYASGSNEVRVALGGYGTQWQDLLPWTTLDQGTIGPAFAAVDALSTREEDTDHVLAIKRAAQSLDQETARVHAAGRTPCPMVLWFTDGKYEFGNKSQQYRRSLGLPATTEYSSLPVIDKNVGRIMSTGLRYLCGADGPVMSLRLQHTAFLAVALNLKLDFTLVKEIATGDGYPDNATGQDCLLPHYDQGDQGSVDPGSSLTTVNTTATTTATSSPDSCTIAPPSCIAEVTVDVPSLADVAQFPFTFPATSECASHPSW